MMINYCIIQQIGYYCERSVLFYVWSSTRPASSIALSHSFSFKSPWLTMDLVVLLTIHRHYYVKLHPCGIGHQHHTWRVVEVIIEISISASPEECMHASVGKNFNLLALKSICLVVYQNHPYGWAIFLQLPGISTAHTALSSYNAIFPMY